MTDLSEVEAASASSQTRTELVARAAALKPLLAEDAEQADKDRALTPRVVDAMTEAGLLQLMVPKRLNGLETDVSTMLEVVGELSRGDMSAGWVAGVLNFTAWQVGVLGDQARSDVWGENPYARICSVISAAVEYEQADGGIVVTGQWPAASGCLHCEWAFLTVPMAFGPGGPEFSTALIPMEDLTIEDTWYPVGVRASASRTLIGNKVFVPEHRLMPLQPAMNGDRPNSHADEPLYAASFAGVGGIATLAPQLGLADAVIELVKMQSQGRMMPVAGIFDQSESPAFQMRLADAATKIDVAWMLARRVAAGIDAAAVTGDLPDELDRARARMYPGYAADQAHEAIETLLSQAGMSAFMDGTPLQRMWRDSGIASRHTAYRLDPVRELFGRVLLGKGPGASMLF